MKYSLYAVSLLLVLATVASCNKETEHLTDGSAAYFPVTQGHYVVYQTDSTVWNDFTRTVTRTSCQLRYTVGDTFHDLNDAVAYKVMVDRRDSANGVWAIHSAFYVVPTTTALDYVQSNLRFRKLVFPVADGRSWAGNNQIATSQPELQYFQGWEYRYSDVGMTYNHGLKSFDNTATVLEADMATGNDTLNPQDYADRTFSKEVYAKSVGMLYREQEHWIYDRSTNQQFFRKGYAVKMRAVESN